MRLIALLVAGVINPFAPPLPYGPGHRGVDFAATPGQTVRAPGAGQIAFAGTINGVGTVTITVGTKKVTLQPVLTTLTVGSQVAKGEVIGRVHSAAYHCTNCLHVGVRDGGRYINPLYLSRSDLLPVGRSVWIDDH